MLFHKVKNRIFPAKARTNEIDIRDQNMWEREYADGRWNYLSSSEQLPRYSVIEGWRNYYKPDGRVLDIGCGEGIVLSQSELKSQIHYLGVDVSQAAINKAKQKIRNPLCQSFICCKIEDFNMMDAEGFDLIIFNEVLYYLPNYLDILYKFQSYLKPGGMFLVSISHSKKRTWQLVDKKLEKYRLNAVYLRGLHSPKGWQLGIYCPQADFQI